MKKILKNLFLLSFFLCFLSNHSIYAQSEFELKEVIKFKDIIVNRNFKPMVCKDGFFYTVGDKKKWTQNALHYYSELTNKSVELEGMKIDNRYEKYTVFNDKLFFAADDEINGIEIWVSDGTLKGTKMLKDCNLAEKEGSNPNYFTELNGKLYFICNQTELINGKKVTIEELWSTNGTEEGTTKIRTIRNEKLTNAAMVVFRDKLFFSGSDSTNGNQLWMSDGTEKGTGVFRCAEFSGNKFVDPRSFIIAGEKMFFSAQKRKYHAELYVSDGTDAGTHWVKDLENDGLRIVESIIYNGKLYFINSTGPNFNNQYQLWSSDGTEKGTVLVKGISPVDPEKTIKFELPKNLFLNDGNLYFTELRNTENNLLWSIDSKTNLAKTPDIKKDCNPSQDQLDVFNNFNYAPDFIKVGINKTKDGFILSKSYGTVCSSIIIKNVKLDIPKTGNLSVDVLNQLGGYKLFSISSNTGAYPNTANYYVELWATDGTEKGTFKLSPKRPEKDNEGIYSSIANGKNDNGIFKNSFYFLANFNGHNSIYKLTFK